uniref:ATP synthase complex subunit 8 n=1 Tax=Lomis hirta TaxID=177234 RepID=A0A3S6IXA0_9EUCA|nr:ATP synthase F0 subunit 8 [Lomis hirta]
MPQMAPLMWLNLMIMFLMSLMLFFIINYFNSTPKTIDSSTLSLQPSEKLWKW